MKKLLFVGLILSSGFAMAAIDGALTFNSGNTEAKLVMNETMEDGSLSQLFDQMNIQETGSEIKKEKSFELSNKRFSFSCLKEVFSEKLPSTSCTFNIISGVNNPDTNTAILKLGFKKVAIINVSKTFANELEGVFPTDENGYPFYSLKLSNGVGLDVEGLMSGHLNIGFVGP